MIRLFNDRLTSSKASSIASMKTMKVNLLALEIKDKEGGVMCELTSLL